VLADLPLTCGLAEILSNNCLRASSFYWPPPWCENSTLTAVLRLICLHGKSPISTMGDSALGGRLTSCWPIQTTLLLSPIWLLIGPNDSSLRRFRQPGKSLLAHRITWGARTTAQGAGERINCWIRQCPQANQRTRSMARAVIGQKMCRSCLKCFSNKAVGPLEMRDDALQCAIGQQFSVTHERTRQTQAKASRRSETRGKCEGSPGGSPWVKGRERTTNHLR
jgi:hypothetical protein